MPPFVVFDLDDSLVDYKGTIDLALGPFALAGRLPNHGLAFLCDVNAQPLTVTESWQIIATQSGLDDTADELALTFAAAVPGHNIPYAGALVGLAALREAGWRTALLSNGIEYEQRIKMRDNMADLFDAMRFYDERGPREPDPALSAEVARRAHAERAGARMVGDSLTSDVRGDLAVGMTTVGISRGHPLPEGGPQPHDVVADTFSLLATVQADSTAHTPRSST